MTQMASELEATKQFGEFKERVDALESLKAMVKSLAMSMDENDIFQSNASNEERDLVEKYK